MRGESDKHLIDKYEYELVWEGVLECKPPLFSN